MPEGILEVRTEACIKFLQSIFGDGRYIDGKIEKIKSDLNEELEQRVKNILISILKQYNWDEKGCKIAEIVRESISKIEYSTIKSTVEQIIDTAISEDQYILEELSRSNIIKRIKELKVEESNIKVAIIGKTKVGKTTLINKLLGKLVSKIGYISSQTNSIDPIIVEGWDGFMFFDTPGYLSDYNGWSLKRLMEIYRQNFDVVILVTGDGIDSNVQDVFNSVTKEKIECLLILNKSEFLRMDSYEDTITQQRMLGMKEDLYNELRTTDANIFFTFCMDTKCAKYKDCREDQLLYHNGASQYYKPYSDDTEKIRDTLREIKARRDKEVAVTILKSELRQMLDQIFIKIKSDIYVELSKIVVTEIQEKLLRGEILPYSLLQEIAESIKSNLCLESDYEMLIEDYMSKNQIIMSEFATSILRETIKFLQDTLIKRFYILQINDQDVRLRDEAFRIADQLPSVNDILNECGIIVEVLDRIYSQNYINIKQDVDYVLKSTLREDLSKVLLKLIFLHESDIGDKKLFKKIKKLINEMEFDKNASELLKIGEKIGCREEFKVINQIYKIAEEIRLRVLDADLEFKLLKTEGKIVIGLYEQALFAKLKEVRGFTTDQLMNKLNEFLFSISRYSNLLYVIKNRFIVKYNLDSEQSMNTPDHVSDESLLLGQLSITSSTSPEELFSLAAIYKKGTVFSPYFMDCNLVTRFLMNIIHGNSEARDFLMISEKIAARRRYTLGDRFYAHVKMVEEDAKNIFRQDNARQLLLQLSSEFDMPFRMLFTNRLNRIAYIDQFLIQNINEEIERMVTKNVKQKYSGRLISKKIRVVDEGIMYSYYKKYENNPKEDCYINEKKIDLTRSEMLFPLFEKKPTSAYIAEDLLKYVGQFLIMLSKKGVVQIDGGLYINKKLYQKIMVGLAPVFDDSDSLFSKCMNISFLSEGECKQMLEEKGEEKEQITKILKILDAIGIVAWREGIVMSREMYHCVEFNEIILEKDIDSPYQHAVFMTNVFADKCFGVLTDSFIRVVSTDKIPDIGEESQKKLRHNGLVLSSRSKILEGLYIDYSFYEELKDILIQKINDKKQNPVKTIDNLQFDINCLNAELDLARRRSSEFSYILTNTGKTVLWRSYEIINEWYEKLDCYPNNYQLTLREIGQFIKYLECDPEESKLEIRKFILQIKNINKLSYMGNVLHISTAWNNTMAIRLLMHSRNELDKKSKDRLGNTVLHLAVLAKNIDAINCLIYNGFSTEDPNYNGDTPLVTASYVGNVDVIKALICNGADLNALGNNRRSGLDIILQDGSFEVVAALFETGVIDNSFIYMSETIKNISARTYIIDQLGNSERDRIFSRFNLLQKKELMEKLNDGNCKVSEKLHELVITLNKYLNEENRQVVNKSVIDLEQEAKQEQHISDILNKIKINAIDMHPKIIAEWLLGTIDEHTGTILHTILKYNYDKEFFCILIIKLSKYKNRELIEKILNSCDIDKSTILHLAIRSCPIRIIKCLVDIGADPNKKDYKGWTSLHVVVHYCINNGKRAERIINILLKNGAHENEVDICGKTYLQYAGHYNGKILVDRFRKSGRNKKATIIMPAIQ